MLGALVLGALALSPAAAQAATRSVSIGVSERSAAGKSLGKLTAEFNDFVPHTSRINVGDSLRFVPAGFHNAELPAKGAKPSALLTPTGTKVSGSKDAAGIPFWFNGQDNIGFNTTLLRGGFGKKLTYDGSKTVNSGLPLGGKPKPMTVTFPKAGSYTFFCDVHPGMKGVVKVLAKGKPIPSAKAHKKAAGAQLAKALTTAKTLANTPVPDGEVSVGVRGKNGVELFDFLPKQRTVAVGSVLTFRIPNGLVDTHTASTGPGDPEKEPKSYLGEIAASFEGGSVIDPRGVYSSELPGYTPQTLTPKTHGNGFWSTGAMDAVGASRLPQSGSVTFAAAGTYQFWCLIHPNMHMTVTAK
jgi:plastocyanin